MRSRSLDDAGRADRIAATKAQRLRAAKLRGQRVTDELRLVVLGQPECQQPAYDQRINRGPRRGVDAQDLILQGAAAPGRLCQMHVDAGGVAQQRLTHGR